MKRKVNRVGKDTLTLSLPSSWVKKQGIKKGDELEVYEEGKLLKIIAGVYSKSNIILNVDKFNRTIFIHIVRYYYRQGVKSLTLQFTDPKIFYTRKNKKILIHSVLMAELHKFIGMEIMDQTKTEYVIKCVMEEDIQDYNTCFNRLFYNLNQAFEVLSTEINSESIQPVHDGFTRNANYCYRFLIKKGLESDYKTRSTIDLLEHLELIMDIIEALPYSVSRADDDFKTCILQIKDLFHGFFEYLHKPDMDINQLDKLRIKIEEETVKTKSISACHLQPMLLLLRDIFGLSFMSKN
jgi:hypothetical protein